MLRRAFGGALVKGSPGVGGGDVLGGWAPGSSGAGGEAAVSPVGGDGEVGGGRQSHHGGRRPRGGGGPSLGSGVATVGSPSIPPTKRILLTKKTNNLTPLHTECVSTQPRCHFEVGRYMERGKKDEKA